MVWSELLDNEPIATKSDSLLNQNTITVDHGVNFGGSMNLFGGVTEDMIDTLTELCLSSAQLVSLDMPMPNYAEQLEKRIGQATCHKALGDLLPELKRVFNNSSHVTMADLGAESVTIGDSHSTAFSPKGSAVLRTNGQTLYGALKTGHILSQMNALREPPKRVTLVFGSIDIRHHIGRQDKPIHAVFDLVKRYADLAKQIEQDWLCEVELAAPVPVEYEGRKIPKTGFYKDAPFFGSRDERLNWTAMFIDQLKEHWSKVVVPPWSWYTMDGEEYAKQIMELGSSVHIAPTHYRRYSDWSKDV